MGGLSALEGRGDQRATGREPRLVAATCGNS